MSRSIAHLRAGDIWLKLVNFMRRTV